MRLRRIIAAMAFMLTVLAMETEAQDCKKINSLPASITAGGNYCLTKDLSTSISSATEVAAIEIRADNVLLDLGGFTISYNPPDSTSVVRAIRTFGVRRSVTVRNGTIKGFIGAVYLIGDNVGLNNAGNVVEHLRVQDCLNFGILIYGTGNIVRDNHVVNTVGRPDVASGIATAIGAFGSGNMVINNDVIGTTSAVTDDVSLAQGILFNACNQCVAEKNRIVDTESPNPNSARGIWVETGSDVLVVNNRIIKSVFGIVFMATSTGLYRDNIATACTIPYSGGFNAGNNQ
jgi:hypothetical protein